MTLRISYHKPIPSRMSKTRPPSRSGAVSIFPMTVTFREAAPANPTWTIRGLTVSNCRRSAVSVKGDGGNLDIDGLKVADTPIGIEVDGASVIKVRGFDHS